MREVGRFLWDLGEVREELEGLGGVWKVLDLAEKLVWKELDKPKEREAKERRI